MRFVRIIPAVGLLVASSVAQYKASDPLKYVNPLIGTVNGGHVFPGATLPFGMAKAVADVTGEDQGGFASDGSPITGWSHMHDSGTGGSPSLGNFPIFPQPNCPDDDVSKCSFTKTEREIPRINGSASARPGYFTVSMSSGIKGETTVTNHTALYKFTFSDGAKSSASESKKGAKTTSPLILLDLTDLPDSRSEGYATVDPKTGRITANGTFQPSFGLGSYKMYVCADWHGATVRDVGTWRDGKPVSSSNTISIPDHSSTGGAWVRFENLKSNVISARVGVSFISNAQACSNAEKEIPNFDFKKVSEAAETAWREKLSVVTIDAGDVDDSVQRVFWSGLYRSMISPQDYTGENALWESDEPYYDSYYCIWDSFRSIHPLLTILDPNSQTLMVRSLLDIYRNEGHLPDCRMSLCKGWTQGGSNADIVLSDSYLKGIKDGVDWNLAYEAVIADAEIEPADWGVEGRGGLESWRSHHYIPTDDNDIRGSGPFTRSISRTVEYAYDDFCIALMAKGLGHENDYKKYLERSGWWKNMYKANQTSTIKGVDTGFKGFLQPRYLNYTFGFQDPIFCSPLLNFDSCYLNPEGHETYEGSAWLYTFFVPGDHASLIKTLGGKDTFVKRLDYLHESGLLYIGDEQGFLPVYQYHYAGRPGKSAYRAHSYIPRLFNDTIVGIPGNDDSGAMGSFAALTMMGFFPNPGQDVYFINSPFFPSISIRNGQTGKTATIRTVNFDAGYKNIYVQKATMNGKKYTKNWFTHDFFLNGGTLELTMGPKESKWGTGDKDIPPSITPPKGK